MLSKRIDTLIKIRKTFKEFLLNDTYSNLQRNSLFNLKNIDFMYDTKYIVKRDAPVEIKRLNDYGYRLQQYKYRYNLHLLKMALLDDREYDLGFEFKNCCLNRTNYVFILAMMKGKLDILEFFLYNGFPISINATIFANNVFPTYFQLACALGGEVLEFFLRYKPNYKITWFGLTPQMIASFNGSSLIEKQPYSYLSMEQYYYLNKLRNMHIHRDRNHPIFLLDFYCMNGQIISLKLLLDKYSDVGSLSRLSFISHARISVLKVITEYKYNVVQNYCGITPLHIAAHDNNFNLLAIYLFFKINPNVRDIYGETPLHIAARNKYFLCLELLIRCGGNIKVRNNNEETVEAIYSKHGWKFKPGEINSTDVVQNIIEINPDQKCFTESQYIFNHIIYNKNMSTDVKPRFFVSSFFLIKSRAENIETEIKKLYGSNLEIEENFQPKDSLDIFNRFNI